jgi:hypothetical protein
MKHSFLWFTPLLVIAAGILLLSFQAPQPPSGQSAVATYSHGIVRITIPYIAPHSGVGQLTVEVLDPEDRTLGRIERAADIDGSKGMWHADLKLTKALPIDELVWHRLRYRFVYNGQREPGIKGTVSISEILRMPVIHILGQQSYLTGGPAAVRVIVTGSRNEVIASPTAGSSSLRIELSPADQKPRVLFTGLINHRGTTEGQFRFPAGLAGTYPLHYIVDTPHRVHRNHRAGPASRQSLHSAHYREADLPAGANDSRARAGSRSLKS